MFSLPNLTPAIGILSHHLGWAKYSWTNLKMPSVHECSELHILYGLLTCRPNCSYWHCTSLLALCFFMGLHKQSYMLVWWSTWLWKGSCLALYYQIKILVAVHVQTHNTILTISLASTLVPTILRRISSSCCITVSCEQKSFRKAC